MACDYRDGCRVPDRAQRENSIRRQSTGNGTMKLNQEDPWWTENVHIILSKLFARSGKVYIKHIAVCGLSLSTVFRVR